MAGRNPIFASTSRSRSIPGAFRPFLGQTEHRPFGHVQHRLLAAIGDLTAEGTLLDRFDELGGAAVAPDA